MSDEEVLLGAVLCDHVDVLEEALGRLQRDAVLMWCDGAGRSLLHIAVAARAHFCLAKLIHFGINVNARDRIGRVTPLFLACMMRDEVAAAMLLETPGINVNKVCGNDMETALHVAVDERLIGLIELMMKCGGDPTQTDLNGECAFDKADSDIVFQELMTPLYATAGLVHACSICSLEKIRIAIKSGGSVSVKDEQCRGLLEIAASNSSCCRAVIDLLFENGVKLDPRAISCAVQSGCKEAEAVLKEKKGKKKSLKKPYDIVRASLEGILANDELELVPRKWHLIGDVLLLQSVEKKLLELNDDKLVKIGESFLKCKQIKAESVLLERAGPGGELRMPQMQVLAGRQNTETVHVEGGVKYTLDPAKVMFASANGTERMHFGSGKILENANEIVVDMFAGIGYFSVPLSRSSDRIRPSKIACIEKNPISAGFLRRNLTLAGCDDIAEVFEGDNRVVADSFLGKATRVVMGYIPTPVEFIPRAIAFLRPDASSIVHYHYVATKNERDLMPRSHFEKHLQPNQIHVRAIRQVKDYAPNLFHFVADLEIKK